MNYCEKCNKRVPTRIGKHEEEFPVKGDPVKVVAEVKICEVCGSVCYDEELDSKSMAAAFDVYRQRHDIISPGEVRALLDKYGLSQRGLAALLGWGEITIHRYEGGSIADEAHNQVLRMLQDTGYMAGFFERYRDRLPRSKQRKLDARLKELVSADCKTKNHLSVLMRPSEHEIGPLTGYRRFSPDALQAMIMFFAQGDGVLKTKLNKQLWYADFTYFRHFRTSMSGATYIHLPFGPVPDDYEIYLAALIDDQALESVEVDFSPDLTGEKLVAKEAPDMGALPDSAEGVLRAVNEYFRDSGSKAMSDLSHQEAAYAETKPGKPIPYEYADKLNVKIDVA